MLQGWQDNPKPGLLEKLDKRYVLVQELFGENTNNWETRKGYEGTPFIWATVTNFGERPVSTENYNVLPMKFTVPRIANMRSI